MASAGEGLTSGGESGASGGQSPLWRRPTVLTAVVFVGFGLVYLVVNATSLIDERRTLGQPIDGWQPWIWELTSFLAWLLLLPAILWIASGAQAFGSPARAFAAHLLATVPVSLGHTGAMFAMRKLAYATAGERYLLSGPFLDVLVYEYRKDVITYASIVLTFLVLRRLATAPPPTSVNQPESLIEVRDGSRALWLKPEEIDWVAAAGNYVELNGAFGTKLARRTLAEMQAELEPHGFLRVHRSRLVRKASVAKVETRQSGDFEMTLRSGLTVGGSRRYRGNL